MKRTAALVTLVCVALAGCKQPTADATTAVSGSNDIVVHATKVFQADVGAGSSTQAYYIVCQVTFTNNLGHDVTPEPKNFVFYDAYGQPYPGIDSGATPFIGVSNYSGVVKKDEKQDYTIGFRVHAVTSGAVYYAAY